MSYLNSIQEKVLQNIIWWSADNLNLRPIVRKTLYSEEAERIVLYAAPIWYNGKVVVTSRLLNRQRVHLVCVTKYSVKA